MGKLWRNKNKAPKSRKELRKFKRQEKKQRKFEYFGNRNKPGKLVLHSKEGTDDQDDVKDASPKIKTKQTKIQNKQNVTDIRAKELKAEKDEHKKLQKEMAKQRRKQMEAANEDEDRNIKHLEKQLKLNKRKTKSVPKSFSEDGLDYLLEVCDPENMKTIATAERQFAEANDEFEDDFKLITENLVSKNSRKDLDSESNSNSNHEDFSEDEDYDEEDNFFTNNEKEKNKKNKKEECHDSLDDFNDSYDLENDSDQFNDIDKNKIKKNNKRKNSTDEGKQDKKKSKIDYEIDESDNEFMDEDQNESEIEDIEEKERNTWEDIYGRTRNEEGEIISSNAGKYIPPALRNKTDSKQAEKIARIRKQLKGLLNRLAESNMHSIASQIEEMYMANSRNNMNETLTTLIFEALIAPVHTPERLLLEYILLVTILHANVGTEVGAHFLQTVVHKFNDLYKKNQEVENKELDNTVHTIAQLYSFKVFHSQLLYQILEKLSEKFEEKHVECILLVLKNVGFSLRKDDPIALKQLILDLQKRATTVSDDNARVKFMLEILLAIKNNNVSKIPNYDTTYSEHLKKISKNFIRKGNYVTQLNISLEDLLKAEERGRWWIVGSAWTGSDDKKDDKEKNSNIPSYNQKLLLLAKKQRMNTDTRRNIFCALMTAENYSDAFEKILTLGLKGQPEREIIHVLLHCSLQEKEYNPYYSLIAQKFCEYDRKYQMMIRCSIWDKLKTLTECSGKQISILAKLLTYLFINQGLPISTLKVIQFSELDQITLRLIRQVLLGILLHSNEENCLAVFEKVALSPKLKMFRESLRLFIHHFLLRNLNNSELSDEHKNLLTSRAKLAEKHLTTSDNKIKF